MRAKFVCPEKYGLSEKLQMFWDIIVYPQNDYLNNAIVKITIFFVLAFFCILQIHTQSGVFWNQLKFGWPNNSFRSNTGQWKFCLNLLKKYCWFFFATLTKIFCIVSKKIVGWLAVGIRPIVRMGTWACAGVPFRRNLSRGS